MSQTLSAKFYLENKERLQKKLVKDIKIFLKKKKKKSDTMVVSVTKISQEKEKQKLVEYRKKYCKMRKKCQIIIIRKCFNFKKFAPLSE